MEEEFIFDGETAPMADESTLHKVQTGAKERYTVMFKSVHLRSTDAGTIFVVPERTSRDLVRPFASFERKMLALVKSKFSKVKNEEMIRATLKVCHVDEDSNIYFRFRVLEPVEFDPDHMYNVKLQLAGLKIKRTMVEAVWKVPELEVDEDLPALEDDEEEEGVEEDVPVAEPDTEDVGKIRAGITAEIDAEEAEIVRRKEVLEMMSDILQQIRKTLEDSADVGALNDAAAVMAEYRLTKDESV